MYIIPEIDFYEVNKKIIMANLITGACEIISDNLMQGLKKQDFYFITKFLPRLKERGYIFDSESDYKKYIGALNNKLDYLDRFQAPNFLLIPSYKCNLACAYCYEKNSFQETQRAPINWDKKFSFVLDAVKSSPFFSSGDYDSKRISITLMGGEPFLSHNISSIQRIVSFIKENKFSYNAITNGVEIFNFIYIFDYYKPDSIQITLDGTKRKHDERRILRSGEGSFDKIINSIHMLIDRKIKVYIRYNLDSNNKNNLFEFAKYIKAEFGLSEFCVPYIYPMQDGGCEYEDVILNEETAINLLSELDTKLPDHGILPIFHGNNLVDFVSGKTKLFRLKYRNCAANKNQYIIDYLGHVYKCWYGVGNCNFSIGNCDLHSYNSIANQQIEIAWKNRHIQSLKKCNLCKYRYLCGGGCLSHIYNGSEDSINQPHCVDFQKLIRSQMKKMLRSQ